MPGLTGRCTCGHVEAAKKARGMKPIKTTAFDPVTDPASLRPIVTIHLFDGHPCYVEEAK
jgi:hypothetical protein